ncbi:MAG: MBL fold metallo-hydrolase [Anaerolineales bacterium]
MVKLVILGTATNIPDAAHENTHMVLVGEERIVLVDGPGNPYSRLLQAGLDPDQLTDIVVTHFHPDHAGGIPLLLMAIGLTGRKAPMNLYANQHCMERLVRNLEDYDWEKWHWFPVNLITLPEEERFLAVDCEEFRVFTSPVKHFIPAIGLRVETAETILVYSGDTAPTPGLDRLAAGSQIMIHEAGGESEGHASAKQAGKAAALAGVEELILVHYPVGGYDGELLLNEAGEMFSGKILLGRSFMKVDLG